MFAFSSTKIDDNTLKQQLTDARAGALVTFEGWVRNHNEGQPVHLLEYEAMESLAAKEAEIIISEAKKQFAVYNVSCVHRVGALPIGEMAVWVGVTAAHRGAAFDASRYIIDEIKARLPIWKKEHYTNGTSVWVNCQCTHEHKSLTEAEYYRKQTVLPEMWPGGQAKLNAARVLVVGAGGLGCPALCYLASAGIGTIGICDFDKVDGSNLHRQVLYSKADIGHFKAVVAAEKLRAINPFITVETHAQRLDAGNAAMLLSQYDLILDCTDNFDTKFLLNDIAITSAKTLVQASIYQWEGQLMARTAGGQGQCLRCLWPATPDAGCIGNCEEAGIIGAAVGTLGSMQALEAIKLLLGLDTATSEHCVFFNLLNCEIRKVKAYQNPACSACNGTPLIGARLGYSPADIRSLETTKGTG